MKTPQIFFLLLLSLSIIVLFGGIKEKKYYITKFSSLANIYNYIEREWDGNGHGGIQKMNHNQITDIDDGARKQTAILSPAKSTSPKIDPFSGGIKCEVKYNRSGECVDFHFSRQVLKKTALASYPGSGTTWHRHLIQHLSGNPSHDKQVLCHY